MLPSPDLAAVLTAPVALVYKHSARCPLSIIARLEIGVVAARRPEVPLLTVDVHAQRPLAREIAERVGVTHESPQVILLRHGQVAWHASHLGVMAAAIEARLDAVGVD